MHRALLRTRCRSALLPVALAALAACSSGGGSSEEPTPPVLTPSALSTQVEGAGGATTMLAVDVVLSAAATQAVTVDWATADGSAAAGQDYAAATGTLTFAAGEVAKSVLVTVNDDALDEEDETFTVTFSNPVNATLAGSLAPATIADDDDPPAVAVQPPASAAEGTGAGGATLDFAVALDAPSGRTVTVGWATAPGTAASPADFAAASGTLTFAPGETAKTVQVTAAGDALDEPDETFTVTLSAPVNASLDPAGTTAEATLADDDDPPALSIASSTGAEGNAGRTLDLAVTLDAPSGRSVSVSWATADGTAAAGSDFDAGSGALVFAPGETAKVVSIQVLGDAAVEPDEEFTVALSGELNAAVTTRVGTVTLQNDDVDPFAPVALNDTGLATCGDATSSLLACPVAGAAGQDAEHGRDVTANDSADGAAGFSFVKLGADGSPLADQAAVYATDPWSCVRDQVTGLTWEVKTNDGGLHDTDWYYSWYSTDPAVNAGNAGRSNGGFACHAAGRCDTEKLVADVNAAGLCGHSDWRLPTMEELHSITHLGRSARPFIDVDWFPNVSAVSYDANYWTSMVPPAPASVTYAWGYSFGSSNNETYSKTSTGTKAMLVRGAKPTGAVGAQANCSASLGLTKPTERYTDHADGTVTDRVTGLMWKRCSEGQTWSGTTCTGTATSYQWVPAFQQATAVASAGYAGHSDWRVPNLKELLSLVEWSCWNPSINATVFPATPDSWFWTGTPSETSFGTSARTVRFNTGTDMDDGKTIYDYLRLVRAGG